MSETDLILNANRLAERIAEAKRLRGEGASPEDIARVEPTKEEIRDALMALRSRRAAMPTPKTPRKAQSKMSLDELLGGDI
jgi:hypothetical protein